MAEALADRQPIADARGRETKTHLSMQPKMPRRFLEELARRTRERQQGG